MKIFGKRIGKFLSIVFDGKPKQVVTENEEEMSQYLDLVKKSKDGDVDSINELKDKLFKEREKDDEMIELENEVVEVTGELDTVNKELEFTKNYDEIKKKSDIFEIKNIDNREAVYIKGFQAELPPMLVDEFIKLLFNGEDINSLLNFWKANLLNKNAEARRGLYNFIKKQKLIVVDGYFIAFRSVYEVFNKSEDLRSLSESEDFSLIVSEFAEKIKKWRKGRRSFEVYFNAEKKTYELKPVKNHEKNSKDYNLTFKGIFHDIYEAQKLNISKTDPRDEDRVFTDGHTRTMVIKLGKPVRMDRAKCNTDGNVSCSFGLHVGSESFVSKGGFGDTIIAVAINPQHVISVPYSDAHKMRVCEYLPLMILTKEQLKNFESIDFSKHVSMYKKIESEGLKKALNVIDNLDTVEFQEFSIQRKVTSQEDIDKIIDDLKIKKDSLSKKQKQLEQILDDDISNSLNVDEIRNIIKSRLN